MSSLAGIYESFNLAAIRQLIADHRTEDLHVEFKTLADPAFNRDDRRNLAKSVSGFANSDGGIVIWGVDARPDADGVDCAQSAQLVANVDMALGRLQNLTGDAASPVPGGVLHRAIPADGQAGFVVTLVPESDSGPHMAKLGEHRYFKRSGDRFYLMEHFDLEDMFGRRKRPVLELVHRVERESTSSGPGGTVHDLRVVLGIGNKGRGIARFPFLELGVDPPYGLSRFGLDGNRHVGLPRLVRSSTHASRPVFAGGVDDVIHVGSVHDVTALANIEVHDAERHAADIRISYVLRAEETPAVEGVYVIMASDILKAIG